MAVPTATQQPAPHSALRRLVARHPVAAFLVMVYTVNTAVALVPVLTRRDILPFDLAPYDSLGHIFGVALPAFLVVARRRPVVPHRVARGARRDGIVRQRDLWSGTAERAGGEVGAAVDGGIAATASLDLVLQSCRRDRLDGILAGEAAREARAVEGQPHCHGPLRAVPYAQLDGRIRLGPRTAPPRPPVDWHFRNISAVRARRHHVALQQHHVQRATGGDVPL